MRSTVPVPRDPSLPRHVAIVMDGNGRWAKQRFLPRFFGHKQGVDALVRTVQACADRGIEYLTVFAFSSENWKRSADEVSGLMGLVLVAVSKYLTKLAGEGVRIRIVGDRGAVSEKVLEAWDHAERTTAANTRITLSGAFNYGGRWDMLQAAQRAMADGISPTDLREDDLSARMALSYAPDPDLFIDHVHYNARGSDVFAGVVAEAILAGGIAGGARPAAAESGLRPGPP